MAIFYSYVKWPEGNKSLLLQLRYFLSLKTLPCYPPLTPSGHLSWTQGLQGVPLVQGMPAWRYKRGSGSKPSKIVQGGWIIWLVVITILKNINQWEGWPPIYGKIKNDPKHQPVILMAPIKNWLVVLTILNHINQWEGLFPIYGQIKNVPKHQPVVLMAPIKNWLVVLTILKNII